MTDAASESPGTAARDRAVDRDEAGGRSPEQLATARLLLRRLTLDDAAALFRVTGDPVVMRYWYPGPDGSIVETSARIAAIDDHWLRHGFGDWAVVHKPDDRLIGFAGLHRIADMDAVNIGYVLARDHWRRGLGREVATALLAHAFERLNLPEVVAVVDPRNTSSVELALVCGLRERRHFEWMKQRRLELGIARQEWLGTVSDRSIGEA